jgi:sugar phosphate isomerase/epimerase
VGLVVTAFAVVAQAEEQAQKEKQRVRDSDWQLAVQTYTFRDLTFLEAVERAAKLRLRFVEGLAWQKISPAHGDAELNYHAPEAAIEDVRKKLEATGVKLVNCYVADFGKNEEEYRKVFAFGKKMGIETFVAEPPPELLPTLDKLAQEYEVNLAIHNHARDPNNESYIYWNPEKMMKTIKDLSKRVGCCADTGHWVRSELDPVECLKKYEGRLICLHLKDVNEKSVKGEDVPFGTGVSDIEGQLKELHRQKFKGVIAIEYESTLGKNIGEIEECVRYFRQMARQIRGTPASREAK